MSVVSADLTVKQSKPRLDGKYIADGMAELSGQFNSLLQALYEIDSEVLENLYNSPQKQFYRDYLNLDMFIDKHETKQISFSFISFLQIPFELASGWEPHSIDWVSHVFTDSVKSKINKVLVRLSVDGSGDLAKIFTESNDFYKYIIEFDLKHILLKLNDLLEYLKLIASSTQVDLRNKFDANIQNLNISLIELDEFRLFVSDSSWNKFRNLKSTQIKGIDLSKLYVDYYQLSAEEKPKVYNLYLEDLIFQNVQNTNEIEKLNKGLDTFKGDYRNNLKQNIEELTAAKAEYDSLKATFDRINSEYAEVKGSMAAKVYGTEYQAQYEVASQIFVGNRNSHPGVISQVVNTITTCLGREKTLEINFFEKFKSSPFNSILLVWIFLSLLFAGLSLAPIVEMYIC